MWRYPNSVGEPARLTMRHLITCLGLWNHLKDKFNESVVDNRATLIPQKCWGVKRPASFVTAERFPHDEPLAESEEVPWHQATAGVAASSAGPTTSNQPGPPSITREEFGRCGVGSGGPGAAADGPWEPIG
jgi:hypothetical protein